MGSFRTDSDPTQQHLLGLSLDDLVQPEHRVRRFVALLKRLDFTVLRMCYAGRGKPAYPPEAMFGLFVWTLERFGPVSLRRMQEFAATDMTCRLAADGYVPDHVTIADFLSRCGDQFATLHAALLKVLFEEGLLTGRTPVVDGSKIRSARAGSSSVLRPGTIFDRLESLAKKLRELYGRLVADTAKEDSQPPLPEDEASLGELAKKVTAAFRDLERLRVAASTTLPEKTDAEAKNALPANSSEKSDATPQPSTGSPIADQALSLIEQLARAKEALAQDFRRLPRQLHPGDPEMQFVKTAAEGIRPGANLQVLSTEDGFVQVVTLIGDATDLDAMEAVLDAAAVQRPAELGKLEEIVTDGGYASWKNADACAMAGVTLCTPALPAAQPQPKKQATKQQVGSVVETAVSQRRHRGAPELEGSIIQALQEGPRTGRELRSTLAVRAETLGQVLRAAEKKGLIRRGKDGWDLVQGAAANDTPETTTDAPSLRHETDASEPEQFGDEAARTCSDDFQKSVEAAAASSATSTEPLSLPHEIVILQGRSRPVTSRSVDERILCALEAEPLKARVLRKKARVRTETLCRRLRDLERQGAIRKIDAGKWALGDPAAMDSIRSTPMITETASPAPEAKTAMTGLTFEWEAAFGTFLCPAGRPMSPRVPDQGEHSASSSDPTATADPISGVYVASGCQICPLAKTCLSTTQLKARQNKQISVGGASVSHTDRAFRRPEGHEAWRESTSDQRRTRSQHAEGRFLSLKHLRRLDRLPYRGRERNGVFALLGGISYNVRRATDLVAQKEREAGLGR